MRTQLLSLYNNPKSVIRLLRANDAIFLSSVSSLLGYNGTPLRPQSDKTSVQKQSNYHHNANDRFGIKRKRTALCRTFPFFSCLCKKGD